MNSRYAIPGRGNRLVLTVDCSDKLWDLSSLAVSDYKEVFCRGEATGK
jgi:hypothetical protein